MDQCFVLSPSLHSKTVWLTGNSNLAREKNGSLSIFVCPVIDLQSIQAVLCLLLNVRWENLQPPPQNPAGDRKVQIRWMKMIPRGKTNGFSNWLPQYINIS